MHGTFSSKVVEKVCAKLGIKKTIRIPCHSGGNGCNERVFRTWREMIAKLSSKRGHDWGICLSAVTCAYNISIHATIGEIPFSPLHEVIKSVDNSMAMSRCVHVLQLRRHNAPKSPTAFTKAGGENCEAKHKRTARRTPKATTS